MNNRVHWLRETDKFIKRAVHYRPAERQKRLKKYYKFMFVREPLERLLSAYLFVRNHAKANITKALKRRRKLKNGHEGNIARKW